ncbi:hypothetical protein GIB67_033431 [Kingdonia uniflora]|uniref:Major facilitator superfamily (MFS) profile domain-containing protein n=1 Tax=Kingdonia uniflora TaxID=39325 RepID=A0A7J7LU55_9MAGN|nr:hypothetical protein GIB67_033431 [Kingdonia uniflora]
MAEGGVIHKAGKTNFFDCFHLSRSNPYILRLALSAEIGGILFGYDTGIYFSLLLKIIVSMAVAGAIVGTAIGGWMNDSWGRRISILIADVLFAIGAINEIVSLFEYNMWVLQTSGTWRWMLGVAAVPAVIQFTLMMFLPESPHWLYRKHVFLTSFLFYQDRKEEATAIVKKLYPPHEVETKVKALRLSVEAEIAEEGSIGAGNIFTKIKNA